MWFLLRLLFGRSEGGAGDGDSAEPFVAEDLLRHLQEQEEYEILDLFEGKAGKRVPASRRRWLETNVGSEEAGNAASWHGQATEDTASADVSSAMSWLMLSLAEQPRPAKGRGKAPGPPPSAQHAGKGSGKAPPKPKAKAQPPPPPFGKRLHWKPLPASTAETSIFSELDPWRQDVPLDTQQLERFFAPVPKAAPLSTGAGAGAGSAAVSSLKTVRDSHGLVTFLDGKRAQNLAIALRQVKLPMEELGEVLRWMRLSHAGVTSEMVQHVHDNVLPVVLDVPELAAYHGPPEALRDIERKLLPLARLSRLKARVQILLFSKSMPGLHASLQGRIRALNTACHQVRGSHAFRRVLETVMRVGTFLNHGIDRPDPAVEVRGFLIEGLLKLKDFRAQGGDVTALHCVVLHLQNGSKDQDQDQDLTVVQRLRLELRGVLEQAHGGCLAGEGLADLSESVGNFVSELDSVKSEIERFAEHYRQEKEGSAPLKTLHRLVEDATELGSALEEELAEALSSASALLGYFGERGGSLPAGGWYPEALQSVERFFTIVREFTASLEDAWRDAKRLRLGSQGSAGTALPSGSVPGIGKGTSAAAGRRWPLVRQVEAGRKTPPDGPDRPAEEQVDEAQPSVTLPEKPEEDPAKALQRALAADFTAARALKAVEPRRASTRMPS